MLAGNRRLSKRTVSTIPHGTLRAHAANRSSSVPKTHPALSAPDVQGESYPALSFDAMNEERPRHAGRIDAVLRALRGYGGALRTRMADRGMTDPAIGTRETPRPHRAARDVGTSIGHRSALARSIGAESAPRFIGLGRRDLGSSRHPLAIAQRLEEGGVRHAAVRFDIENAQQAERRDR